MTIFYTVDRAGTLRPGQTISLQRYEDVHPTELQTHLDELFPDGVTTHGELYFVRSNSPLRIASPAIELVWENVRRARFPEAPSRFQSAFAVEDIGAARAFQQVWGQGPIWAVEARGSFRADMSLLHADTSALMMSYLAELYWSQRTHPEVQTVWETLLLPPVRIVERIA